MTEWKDPFEYKICRDTPTWLAICYAGAWAALGLVAVAALLLYII